MIYQLQHQYPDGRRDYWFAQSADIPPDAEHGTLACWLDSVTGSHELPEGAEWVCVNQDSPLFYLAADE